MGLKIRKKLDCAARSWKRSKRHKTSFRVAAEAKILWSSPVSVKTSHTPSLTWWLNPALEQEDYTHTCIFKKKGGWVHSLQLFFWCCLFPVEVPWLAGQYPSRSLCWALITSREHAATLGWKHICHLCSWHSSKTYASCFWIIPKTCASLENRLIVLVWLNISSVCFSLCVPRCPAVFPPSPTDVPHPCLHLHPLPTHLPPQRTTIVAFRGSSFVFLVSLFLFKSIWIHS